MPKKRGPKLGSKHKPKPPKPEPPLPDLPPPSWAKQAAVLADAMIEQSSRSTLSLVGTALGGLETEYFRKVKRKGERR